MHNWKRWETLRMARQKIQEIPCGMNAMNLQRVGKLAEIGDRHSPAIDHGASAPALPDAAVSEIHRASRVRTSTRSVEG
jgi:hypothetical protein